MCSLIFPPSSLTHTLDTNNIQPKVIGETAPYLYAPLLKNWMVAFTPNLWHAVQRQLGQLETRGSLTWRVWMSPAFWSMKMTRIDKEEFTEAVTLSLEDLDPLGGIQVHSL